MPFIVHCPAKVAPGGINDESIICAVDILPSLAYITGADLPKGFEGDGEDMGETLLGTETQKRKTDLMWDFGRNEFFRNPAQPYHQSQHLAIRRGDWKLLVNSDGTELALYNLKKDRSETTDMADKHPELSAELSNKVIDWYKTEGKVRTEMPIKG
jgi:arylsulfatase A-like enzyme